MKVRLQKFREQRVRPKRKWFRPQLIAFYHAVSTRFRVSYRNIGTFRQPHPRTGRRLLLEAMRLFSVMRQRLHARGTCNLGQPRSMIAIQGESLAFSGAPFSLACQFRGHWSQLDPAPKTHHHGLS